MVKLTNKKHKEKKLINGTSVRKLINSTASINDYKAKKLIAVCNCKLTTSNKIGNFHKAEVNGDGQCTNCEHYAFYVPKFHEWDKTSTWYPDAEDCGVEECHGIHNTDL